MATHAVLRDDDAIEREIQAKGKIAARVTPQDIEELIAETHYFTAEDGVYGASIIDGTESSGTLALSLPTFCVLVLRNGFTVTGESACASPENFDAEIGRKVARANAVQKIWPLEGYLLKQRLYESARPADVQA
ncbi:Gp49 family protein [Burkholderia cenocepacia]|uniref:Gp49 family protein n=1 Tax=Burkholderia cenocepacia TaxID=95486 RepID=UPI0038B8BF5E